MIVDDTGKAAEAAGSVRTKLGNLRQTFADDPQIVAQLNLREAMFLTSTGTQAEALAGWAKVDAGQLKRADDKALFVARNGLVDLFTPRKKGATPVAKMSDFNIQLGFLGRQRFDHLENIVGKLETLATDPRISDGLKPWAALHFSNMAFRYAKEVPSSDLVREADAYAVARKARSELDRMPPITSKELILLKEQTENVWKQISVVAHPKNQ